jgi:hypothetical protein
MIFEKMFMLQNYMFGLLTFRVQLLRIDNSSTTPLMKFHMRTCTGAGLYSTYTSMTRTESMFDLVVTLFKHRTSSMASMAL